MSSMSGYPLGCPNLSHLDNCENFTCPDDMVKCQLSYCIQVHYVGDGIMDCRYGEDEYYMVQVGNDQLKQYVALYYSNGMCLGLPLYYNQEPGWMYAMSIFIILNFIIFTLVATGQAAIFIAATTGNITLVESKRKQDVDVARQLCLIAMSNFLCWFPVSLIGSLSMTGTSVSLQTGYRSVRGYHYDRGYRSVRGYHYDRGYRSVRGYHYDRGYRSVRGKLLSNINLFLKLLLFSHV
ncbi:hypothetical protein Btru_045089 [Bulinus truncatus]|nr:hypothetical protein Btru_045089 [Bulinus truncatus]